MAQVRGAMVFELANSIVLPFDCQSYAVALKKYADTIYNISMKHPQEMKAYMISFGMLQFTFQFDSCVLNISHCYFYCTRSDILFLLRSVLNYIDAQKYTNTS